VTWKGLHWNTVFDDVDVVGVGVGVFVFGRATKTNTDSQSRCFLLLFWCPVVSPLHLNHSLCNATHTAYLFLSSLFAAECDLNPNAVMGDSHQHCSLPWILDSMNNSFRAFFLSYSVPFTSVPL